MRLRSLRLLSIAFAAAALSCFGQTGTVTFYSFQPSVGEQFADGFIPVGRAPFQGFLYDGKQRMAQARGGRFASFVLPAGEHDFSASYRHLSPGDPSTHLKVEDGGHYCVRLSARYKSGSIAFPLAFFHSVIEQVPCDKAAREAGTYKPLDLKKVDAAIQSELAGFQSFPKE